MPEMYIVTINDVEKNFEVDLEIPSSVPFKIFKRELLEILKILNEAEFGKWEDFKLIFQNRCVADDKTLENLGAFDGSRLIVAK